MEKRTIEIRFAEFQQLHRHYLSDEGVKSAVLVFDVLLQTGKATFA